MQPEFSDLDTPLFGARCALHAESPASIICARCGSYACPSCERRGGDGRSYCGRCAQVPAAPAERGSRLVAEIVDRLAVSLPFIGMMFLGIMLDRRDGELLLVCMGLGLLGMLAVLAYQAVLVSRGGQSIGKRMMGLRVVRADGGPVDVWRVILLRNVVPFAINAGCGLFAFVDALLIFGEDRRCLHDLIADTRVVQANEREPPR